MLLYIKTIWQILMTICIWQFIISSIVNEVIKTISRQFIFFTKRFWAYKKHQNAKQTTSPFVVREKLLPLLFFVHLFFWLFLLVSFELFCIFECSTSFRKKNKLAWNCPDNLIYYASDVYPYQPAYRQFICTHLFLYVIICESFFFLWESFLSVRISSYCKNLCHLCESVSLWKQACVWIPSFETNILSSKHDNDILLISYVPISCFLLWILFILCLIIFLLTKCL